MTEPELADQIAEIKDQEARLVFPHFTHADAWRLGTVVHELATSRGLGVAWDVRRGEQIAAHGSTEGSSAFNDLWIERKVRLARLIGKATLLVRLEAELSGWNPGNVLQPLDYAVAGGCVPIRVAGGAMVGTLTVSGLPDAKDHALAIEAIESFLSN